MKIRASLCLCLSLPHPHPTRIHVAFKTKRKSLSDHLSPTTYLWTSPPSTPSHPVPTHPRPSGPHMHKVTPTPEPLHLLFPPPAVPFPGSLAPSHHSGLRVSAASCQPSTERPSLHPCWFSFMCMRFTQNSLSLSPCPLPNYECHKIQILVCFVHYCIPESDTHQAFGWYLSNEDMNG